jgi:hypothetical protein
MLLNFCNKKAAAAAKWLLVDCVLVNSGGSSIDFLNSQLIISRSDDNDRPYYNTVPIAGDEAT